MPSQTSSARPGNRRAQQKAATREVILKAARELFEEKGFEPTTIRAVAARAGVGLGTVMSHFPDKEALLTAALLDDWNAFMAQGLADMPPGLDWRGMLLHLCGTFYDYYARRPALSRALLRAMLMNPRLWNGGDLTGKETEAMDLAAAVLAQAQASGEIRAEVDCHEAAAALMALYQFALFEGLTRSEVRASDMRDRLESLSLLVLRGLAPAEK